MKFEDVTFEDIEFAAQKFIYKTGLMPNLILIPQNEVDINNIPKIYNKMLICPVHNLTEVVVAYADFGNIKDE